MNRCRHPVRKRNTCSDCSQIKGQLWGKGRRLKTRSLLPTAILSLSQFIDRINKSAYKLDTIAVVGLFGGDRAINALETIHFYAGRRWAGWYNYPGSMAVAMRFGQIATSGIWESIFPGLNRSPTDIFNLAGESGPDYYNVCSRTASCTGYLAHLIAELYKEPPCLDIPQIRLVNEDGSPARESSMPKIPILTLSDKKWARREPNQFPSQTSYPGNISIPIAPISNSDAPLALWSILPSSVSTLACVFCFLGHDIVCAFLILLGILASTFSSFALGSATLGIYAPPSISQKVSGDGLMFPTDRSIIILKGSPTDVDAVTEGEFKLEYAPWVRWNDTHPMIGISSLVLGAQLFAQFIFLPRCTLFGQIMTLGSFVASSMYHLYVASKTAGRERLHLEALLRTRNLKERMKTWRIGTTTQMVVFTCLVLGEGNPEPLSHANLNALLARIKPDETPVWRYWRKEVIRELDYFWEWASYPSSRHVPYVPSIRFKPEDWNTTEEKNKSKRLTEEEVSLLETLINDARCVFRGYPIWRDGESAIWRGKRDDIQRKENYVPDPAPESERFVSLSASEI